MVDYRPSASTVRDIEAIGGECRDFAALESVIYDVSRFKSVFMMGSAYWIMMRVNFCSDPSCSIKKLSADLVMATDTSANGDNNVVFGFPVDVNYPYMLIYNNDSSARKLCFALFGVR